MTKLALAKNVVSFVVGSSVGHCVTAIVAQSLDPKNTREKAEVLIGSYVIGAMVAGAAKTWTDEQIDGVVKTWNEMKSKKN